MLGFVLEAELAELADGFSVAAQRRRHHHQVHYLRHKVGQKKQDGGRQDDSERYCDEVNAVVVVDWIGHSLGLFQVGGRARV